MRRCLFFQNVEEIAFFRFYIELVAGVGIVERKLFLFAVIRVFCNVSLERGHKRSCISNRVLIHIEHKCRYGLIARLHVFCRACVFCINDSLKCTFGVDFVLLGFFVVTVSDARIIFVRRLDFVSNFFKFPAGVDKFFNDAVCVLLKVFCVDIFYGFLHYVEEFIFFRFYEEVVADVCVIKRECAVGIYVFIDVSLIQVFLSDGICQRICVLQNRIIGVRVVSVVFIARCARIVFDIIVHIADKHADKQLHNARHYLNLQAFVAKEYYGVEFGQVDVRRRSAVALVDKPFKEPDKVEFQRDGLNNRAVFRFEIQRRGFLVIVKTKEYFFV